MLLQISDAMDVLKRKQKKPAPARIAISISCDANCTSQRMWRKKRKEAFIEISTYWKRAEVGGRPAWNYYL